MGTSIKPSPPQTPNAGALNAAQTANDVGTATANAWMQNANVSTPMGSVSYSEGANKAIQVPVFGPDGSFAGMQSFAIPTFNRNETLAPAQQQMLNQQNQLGIKLNDTAINQADKIGGILNSPISAGSLPPRTDSYGPAPSMARVGTTFADTGQAHTALPNSDYAAQRKSVEDAIYSRINPQLDRDRNNLETKLVNQGLARGSQAFDTAMDESNRQANDARMQAILAGGGEQSRLAGIDLQAGQFFNAGQGQNFDQANQRGMFGLQAANQNNAAAQQEYGNTQSAVQFGNENRDKALQETLALRNQPINEISALMAGGQVSLPQFQQYNPGTVANNNLGQNMYQSAALNMDAYKTKQATTNALIGALGGAAGAGLYGLGKKYG